MDPRPITDVFAGKEERVVYLTSEAEVDLEEVETGNSYVIGGIVGECVHGVELSLHHHNPHHSTLYNYHSDMLHSKSILSRLLSLADNDRS